jgi:hypothetical protein
VGIDQRSKVRHLIRGIKTKTLDTVKSQILSSATLWNDFDACVNLYQDYIAQMVLHRNIIDGKKAPKTTTDKSPPRSAGGWEIATKPKAVEEVPQSIKKATTFEAGVVGKGEFSDATDSMPVVEQYIGFDSQQVDKLLMRIFLGYHITSTKQVDISINAAGTHMRLVYPNCKMANNVRDCFEKLKQCNGVDPKDADCYYSQVEQQMKKKRKTINATMYEVNYIKLLQSVDPSVKPWWKIMRMVDDSVTVFVTIMLPTNNAYAKQEEDEIINVA